MPYITEALEPSRLVELDIERTPWKPDPCGKLASMASRVLMIVFYAARMARLSSASQSCRLVVESCPPTTLGIAALLYLLPDFAKLAQLDRALERQPQRACEGLVGHDDGHAPVEGEAGEGVELRRLQVVRLAPNKERAQEAPELVDAVEALLVARAGGVKLGRRVRQLKLLAC